VSCLPQETMEYAVTANVGAHVPGRCHPSRSS
jgi:hypothetical protein